MEGYWDGSVQWFLSLGEKYGVDPIIFGSIYVGAIPLFTLSVAWIVRNKRKGRALTLPILSTGFWFVSAYLYLFITGENLPWWVYTLVALLLGYGGYASYRKFRSQLGQSS